MIPCTMYIADDFDELFRRILSNLENAPEYSPRDQKTKEIINAKLELNNPKAALLCNPHRKISEKYVGAEILWYLEGQKSIEGIKEYAEMWKYIADPNGEVNSCYGWQIWTQKIPGNYDNQWDYVLHSLAKDMYSRQAVININQPIHKYETKDVPCTIAIQYLIRDNKLDCIVTMRSCDVIFGLGNDIPFFTFLQIKLLHELKKWYPNLELGKYYHNCGSLHIYERHYEMMKKINEDGETYYSAEWFDSPARNIELCKQWKQ